MVPELAVARSEFVLGGQRSGKSRRAEMLARTWLQASPVHHAVFIATAQPWDAEMYERIARHQQDRAERVPGMVTVEEPLALGDAIAASSRSDTLVVVDCLTLWLTNLRMPAAAPSPLPPPEGRGGKNLAPEARASEVPSKDLQGSDVPAPSPATRERAGVRAGPGAFPDPAADAITTFLAALQNASGPLVLVSNEIGLGVIPMGAEVRAFVDALGRLNQQVAQHCARVTLMAAGLPLTLKDTP